MDAVKIQSPRVYIPWNGWVTVRRLFLDPRFIYGGIASLDLLRIGVWNGFGSVEQALIGQRNTKSTQRMVAFQSHVHIEIHDATAR
jgi:hypothetical protein